MTKHVHHDLIVKWAANPDAYFVEYNNPVVNGLNWGRTDNPSWVPDFVYRLVDKPKPDVVKYNIEHPLYGYTTLEELQTAMRVRAKTNKGYSITKSVFDGKTGELKFVEIVKE